MPPLKMIEELSPTINVLTPPYDRSQSRTFSNVVLRICFTILECYNNNYMINFYEPFWILDSYIGLVILLC